MLDSQDDIVIHLPTSVQITSSDTARALEQAWERRRAELADWQPSGGWLVSRQAQPRKLRPALWPSSASLLPSERHA